GKVILKQITADNWQACIQLKVGQDQVDFVPNNLYSIAEAQFYPDAVPLAIYDMQENMVGFVMYGTLVESGQWKIFRLMIDEKQQGKGYGRSAIQQIITTLACKPSCSQILISYGANNDVAKQLYATLGFIEQDVKDNQVTACLKINNNTRGKLMVNGEL
ncbi:MAG: GNAT family N-acetyltransferase, partial [Chloroflexi bacterium]|nr:GNAT family N-acetyltransferase [Chloroflexota bacterium]